MLVDLVPDWRERTSATADAATRVATGVYALSDSAFEWFGDPFNRTVFALFPFWSDRRSGSAAELPDEFSSCDHWEQVTTRWPWLLTDSRPFLLTLRPITAERSPIEVRHRAVVYIGDGQPECARFGDEPTLRQVTLFNVLQLKPEYALTKES